MIQPTLNSTAADGTAGIDDSFLPSNAVFSGDGSKLLFLSEATNLVAGDPNSLGDVFIKDLVTGAVTLIPIADTASGWTSPNNFSISPDGTKVVFSSNFNKIVPGDENGKFDLFVKDLISGDITRYETTINGKLADGFTPQFSPDSKHIIFIGYDINLAGGIPSGK